jgi:hypothetical protein
MSEHGEHVFTAGCYVIFAIWWFVVPEFSDIANGFNGLIIGLAIILSYWRVCVRSFPNVDERECTKCKHLWPKKDVPSDLARIDQCPKCPGPD